MNKEYPDPFFEIFALSTESSIDTNEIKAVKIYTYDFNINGEIEDSTLIDYENLDFFFLKFAAYKYYIRYDSLGREFERYATFGSRTHLDYRKTYDENSNLKEMTGINDQDGQILFKIYYYYDSLSRLVREEKYGSFYYEQPKFEKPTTTTYEYQDTILSRKIQWGKYFDNKGCNSRCIQVYNSNDRLIDYKIETFENDSTTSFWGFKSFYSSSGKLIKKQHYSSDNRNTQTDYKYNPDGLLIEVFTWKVESQEPTKLIRYFYEGQRKTTHNN